MTEAQIEALELLKLVDGICLKQKLNYTLGSWALINYEYQLSEEYFNPNSIFVCLIYKDYLELLDTLEMHCQEYNVDILTYQNRDNFDSLSAWLMYKGKNLLPAGREKDECYYRTRLILTPVFYAGNSISECKRTCKYLKHAFHYIDCRSPLPHKRLFSPMKGKISRTKQRYYCRKRSKYNYSIAGIFEELGENEYADKYLVYKDVANTYAWMSDSEFETERVDFYGVSASIIKNRKEFIERNYRNEIEKGIDKVSELLLRGGYDLRRIQLIQLDMMKEIDRICRKYNLKYNIAFGTLLGAVRHGGFVPWDDDADINMPYEDYLKLIEVIDDELDGDKYYFRYQDKEADCNITYAHLKRNGTIYTKRGRDGFKYHPGVYIDIVPIFNGAPCFLLHALQTRICWTFRTACWAYMGAESEKNKVKRGYYRWLAKMGNKEAYRRFIKAATFFKRRRNKMLFLNGLDRSPYNIGFVKRECFDGSIEIEFEGHRFLAPRDTKGVLNYCYGKDHMKYPPLVKRVPKNDALIELGDLYSDI